MLDSTLKVNQFLMQYCQMLVGDIADERMAEQPLPGVNHPAWILGHLTFSAERARGLLADDETPPAAWAPRFGPGTKPVPSRRDYPAREELLRAVTESFAKLRAEFAAATPAQLARPSTNPYTKLFLPTIQDGVVNLLTAHLGLHLGQLATWRRMIGLPPLF